MHRASASLFFVFSLWAFGPMDAYGRHYYVDPLGSDSNPGTRARPWRSIEKVNAADLGPGDYVHFRSGQRFTGIIELDKSDSGTSGRRLTVASYGQGRAIIDGGDGSGLRASGCNHLIVKDLAFVGSGRKNGNTQDGILIVNSQDVRIEAIETSGFRGSGLRLDGIRDARVTGVHAHDNGFAGISAGYDRPSMHLQIDRCVADNNPGDPSNLTNHSGNGIVIGNVNDAVIEYCEASNNGWDMPRKGNGPVGIWAWNGDRVTIQFCISHDNKSPGDDGGGFDLDGGLTNSILQYNLSYNNDGPGYFLCQYPGAPDFRNNVVRYNISHNDGVKNNRRSGIDVFSASPNASDCQVYNNTVYNANGAAVGFGGLPMPNIVFRNNIFICSGDVVAGDPARGNFENNLCWPADGRELSLAGMRADPRLVTAGAKLPTDPTKLIHMEAYKPTPDSPCLGTGTLIKDNGGRDFWGNKVPADRRPAIGACEKP